MFTLDCGHRLVLHQITEKGAQARKRMHCDACAAAVQRQTSRPIVDGIRTDLCVIEVPCPWPACGAKVGELCRGANGPKSGTHYQRRENGVRFRRKRPLKWGTNGKKDL